MQTGVTAGVSDTLQSLTDALTGSDVTGWDVAAAAVVLVLGFIAARFAGRLTTRTMKRFPGFPDDLVNDAARVTRWLVYIASLALALSFLGVSIGLLSLIVALALIVGALMLRPMIENSAAGMLLMARPSFSTGDQIETAGFRGTVDEIGSRSTVLRTSDGVRIHVPNQQVLNDPIQVLTASDSREATVEIAVALDTDLDAATSTLMTAVTGVDDVASSPQPLVRAVTVTANTVRLSISYWYPSSMTSGTTITDRVIRAALAALREADVVVGVPTLDVRSVTDGSSQADGDA